MHRLHSNSAGSSSNDDEDGGSGTGGMSEMLRTLSDMMDHDATSFEDEDFSDLLAAAEMGITLPDDDYDDPVFADTKTAPQPAEQQQKVPSTAANPPTAEEAKAVEAEKKSAGVTITFASAQNEPEEGMVRLPTAEEQALMAEVAESREMFTQEVEMSRMMFDENQCHVVTDAELPPMTDSGEPTAISFEVQILPQHVLDNALRVRGRKSDGLVLDIRWRKGYPMERGPEVAIQPWHNLLSSSEVDNLYRALAEHAESLVGGPMLSELCGLALSLTEEIVSKPLDLVFAPKELSAKINEKIGHGRDEAKDLFAPGQYIGPVGDLLSKIPKEFDVVNVENVLKEDLAIRFDKMQRFLYKKHIEPLEKDKRTKRMARLDPHIQALADITPAFHGTRMDTIGRIVRNGLLVPSKDTGVKVQTGSRYGNGIYSSPDPELALWYAQRGYQNASSVKVMIVAVLRGKSKTILDGEEVWGGGCTKGFDSHTSEDGKQFCVFHEWQMLPCYVVHLMERKYNNTDWWEEPNARRDQAMDYLPKIAKNASYKERCAIYTAIARRNLPFGYGPAGKRFVVEGIAGYDDDEEDWGEYQMDARMQVDGRFEAHEEYQHETLLKPTVDPNSVLDPNRHIPSAKKKL